MDEYTHDSYTVVRATGLFQDAVDHVLAQRRAEVPEELSRELQEWRERREEGGRKGDKGVEDLDAVEGIPFELVRQVHEQLQKTPMGIK